jgi:hypothetical protein
VTALLDCVTMLATYKPSLKAPLKSPLKGQKPTTPVQIRLTPIEKPLLLVDIDGVISLFGFNPARPPAGTFCSVDGIPHLLSPHAGGSLRQLADSFDLVWCSGWEEKANEYLPLLLGLAGPLPFLHFERAVGRAHTHWKLPAIDAYAGPQRPLAWIDDALDDACRTWSQARPGPTLLVETDPAIGMADPEVRRLLVWADGLPAAPAGCRIDPVR